MNTEPKIIKNPEPGSNSKLLVVVLIALSVAVLVALAIFGVVALATVLNLALTVFLCVGMVVILRRTSPSKRGYRDRKGGAPYTGLGSYCFVYLFWILAGTGFVITSLAGYPDIAKMIAWTAGIPTAVLMAYHFFKFFTDTSGDGYGM